MSHETGAEVMARVRFHIEALAGSAITDGRTSRWWYIGGYDSAGEASTCARNLAVTDAPGRYRVVDTQSGRIVEFQSDGEFVYYSKVRT